MTSTSTPANLLDDDGENQAVRCFLGMYQCGGNPSVKLMKIHLEHSGFNGCWPEWVNDPANAGHLTKGGAQDWLRHLFSLERCTEPAEIATLRRDAEVAEKRNAQLERENAILRTALARIKLAETESTSSDSEKARGAYQIAVAALAAQGEPE